MSLLQPWKLPSSIKKKEKGVTNLNKAKAFFSGKTIHFKKLFLPK